MYTILGKDQQIENTDEEMQISKAEYENESTDGEENNSVGVDKSLLIKAIVSTIGGVAIFSISFFAIRYLIRRRGNSNRNKYGSYREDYDDHNIPREQEPEVPRIVFKPRSLQQSDIKSSWKRKIDTTVTNDLGGMTTEYNVPSVFNGSTIKTESLMARNNIPPRVPSVTPDNPYGEARIPDQIICIQPSESHD